MSRILVTGSEGLIGGALCAALRAAGWQVVGLDLRAVDGCSGGVECVRGDVRDPEMVRRAVEGCQGVVHLAAVSRVVWGEHDPDGCWDTNVGGLRNLLRAIGEARRPLWLLFGSSREVYGHADQLPANEDSPLRPLNVYGRSKVAGERLVAEASGVRAAIVRFSNVYGSTADHPDRVVPAFARAAATGTALRVDGADCTFDFTHIKDTTRGLIALVERLQQGANPPPLHLLTGTPTSLGDLAALAVSLADSRSPVLRAQSRDFDVPHFHGNPTRAHQLLGWSARVNLRRGLARLIADFATETGRERRRATS